MAEAEAQRDTEQLESDAADTVVELDELMNRPGTYFNPQLGLLVIVDDSAEIDDEVFNMEAYEGAEWVHVADEVPVDEEQRDALLLDFQTHYHPEKGAVSESDLAADDEEIDEAELDDDEPLVEGENEPQPEDDE